MNNRRMHYRKTLKRKKRNSRTRKHRHRSYRNRRGGAERQIGVPFYQAIPLNEVDADGNVQPLNPTKLTRDISTPIWMSGHYMIQNAAANAQGNLPNQVIVERLQLNGVAPDIWTYKVVRSPNGKFSHHIYRNGDLIRINLAIGEDEEENFGDDEENMNA